MSRPDKRKAEQDVPSEQRAEEVVLDQTVFTLTPNAYAEFLARLDAPPQPNEELTRMINAKAPWDRV